MGMDLGEVWEGEGKGKRRKRGGKGTRSILFVSTLNSFETLVLNVKLLCQSLELSPKRINAWVGHPNVVSASGQMKIIVIPSTCSTFRTIDQFCT